MNILKRKELTLNNNIVKSAMYIDYNKSCLTDTITIIITILLEDLKKINYWTIPSIYLKNYIGENKLINEYVDLTSMEILEVPHIENEFIKVARLKYIGSIEEQYINKDSSFDSFNIDLHYNKSFRRIKI